MTAERQTRSTRVMGQAVTWARESTEETRGAGVPMTVAPMRMAATMPELDRAAGGGVAVAVVTVAARAAAGSGAGATMPGAVRAGATPVRVAARDIEECRV